MSIGVLGNEVGKPGGFIISRDDLSQQERHRRLDWRLQGGAYYTPILILLFCCLIFDTPTVLGH